MRYRTTILQTGKTTTGIPVPDEVAEALGSSRRPAVKVTVNGYTYRSAVATMGGTPMISLDAEPAARRTFDALSYSNRSWHVLQVTGAKTDETRQRRIAKSVEALKEGRPR